LRRSVTAAWRSPRFRIQPRSLTESKSHHSLLGRQYYRNNEVSRRGYWYSPGWQPYEAACIQNGYTECKARFEEPRWFASSEFQASLTAVTFFFSRVPQPVNTITMMRTARMLTK
jgi:hypothetical protein